MDALITRPMYDPIDIRSDSFKPIAVAFLFIVGRELLLMERMGGSHAVPLLGLLSAPPQTVKEIFLLEFCTILVCRHPGCDVNEEAGQRR